MYRLLPLCSRGLCSRRLLSSRGDGGDVEVLRSRLVYQSKKRGILENDIIIGGFAEKHLKELNEAELRAYDKIINGQHMEWDLYYYCAGKKDLPPELEGCSAFQKLKAFAASKERVT